MTDPADPTVQSSVSGEMFADPFAPPGGGLPAEWGEYERVAPAGRGGMGVVYRGWQKRLGRWEAVKTLHPHFRQDARQLARFKFEAEAAATLDHPNIVPVYGVGEVDGVAYIAMKWVDGEPLADHLPRLSADPKAAARLLAKVARAVHHAHLRGLLHRDLKPANVLVDKKGRPHVTDFGLAKPIADPTDGLTATGVMIGTPHYMAPEQARGDRRPTTAADVYSLGVILYETLTGRPPFHSATLYDLLRRLTADAVPAPRDLAPSVPRDLEAICLKCLEKDPAHRYPSADALADDLEAFARGDGVAARPPGVWGWVRQAVHRTPERFPHYVWEIKVWFGAVVLLVSLGVQWAVAADADMSWVWAAVLAGWLVAGLALQWYMGTRFTRLPETEKHSMLIAVGHLVAHAAVTVGYLPPSGPAAGALAMYPGLFGVTGLALFVVGSTHWGRFFFLGLGMLALAPVSAWVPESGPLLYGTTTAAAMWYWAYAVKVTFGGVAREPAAGHGSDPSSVGSWRLLPAGEPAPLHATQKVDAAK